MAFSAPPPSPAAQFVVAHRAANRLELLRAAEAAGAAAVEADVRFFRGRLEVRHLKSVGPVPIFWDRWEIAPPWRARLLLEELLEAAEPPTELMLDLKGRSRRIAPLTAAAIRPYAETRLLTVIARCWRLLDQFADLNVRRVHSVGTARQLRALLAQPRGTLLDGISIHERLLDARTADELRRVAATIMTWPVNDARRASELLGLGVHGLISDRPDLVAPTLAIGGPA